MANPLVSIPYDGTNGSTVIGRYTSPFKQNVHTETQSILGAYGENANRQFIGLVKYWNQMNLVSTSLLNLTEINSPGAVMEMNAFGSNIDYMVPYKIDAPIIKEVLFASDITKPGIEKTAVPVTITTQFAKGDILSLKSLRNGFQVQVSRDYEVTPYAGAYTTYLETKGDDPGEYIPREYLTAGVQVFKITHASGEFSEDASTLTDSNRTGLIHLSHRTGNSEIWIKHWITSQADQIDVNSLYTAGGRNTSGTIGYVDKFRQAALQATTFVKYDLDKSGKRTNPSYGWMPTIVELMKQELAMMKERQMMWQEGFETRDSRGKIHKVPTGYYQWIKNYGRYSQYNHPRQLPHRLKDLAASIFSNNYHLAAKDRVVKFTMGTGAMIVMQQEFMTQFTSSNPFMIVNDGRNPFLEGLIKGPHDGLQISQPRVVSFQYPELGTVLIEHEPALDFIDEDFRDQEFLGQYPASSYMVFIRDVTSSEYSNAFQSSQRSISIAKDLYDNGPNIVQIRPKGFQETTSIIPGVGYHPTLEKMLGFQKVHIAANDKRGFGVYMNTVAEIFIKDPSRIALLELVPHGYESYL